jgi:hypothetical protein
VIEHFQLLRNVGQFDSVTAGAQLPVSKVTLLYAENSRGKTTLAAILRSLGTGKPLWSQNESASQPPILRTLLLLSPEVLPASSRMEAGRPRFRKSPSSMTRL